MATGSQIGAAVGYILFWGLIGLGFVNFALNGFMLRWLRKDEPALWDSLGQPSVIWNNSMKTQTSVFRFTFGAQCRRVSSSRVRRMCRLIRIVLLVWVVDFSIVVLALVHSSLSK